MNYVRNPIAVATPVHVANLPNGIFSISYDIGTREMQRRPPAGYGLKSTRGIYAKIAANLERAQYHRAQSSVFHSPPNSNAAGAYQLMLQLRAIRPAGIIPAVLHELEMAQVPVVMTVGADVILGGAFSPNLLGLTPANLVPANANGINGGPPAMPPAAMPSGAPFSPDQFAVNVPRRLNR